MITLPPVDWIKLDEPWLCLKKNQHIFTTLEGGNPGGSIKDRMVVGELNALFATGRIRSNTIIGEVSSGSTAMSLAFHCKSQGIKCLLYIPEGTNPSVITELNNNSAMVRIFPLNILYQKFNEELVLDENILNFNQLFDSSKRRHYFTLGAEIARRCPDLDFILGGVGTGHSLIGTAEGIRNEFKRLAANRIQTGKDSGSTFSKKLKVISVEPCSQYRIAGVRNIVDERYGDFDHCHTASFDQRIIINENELFKTSALELGKKGILISDSFKLVLSGAKDLLKKSDSCDIFLLGAASKLTKSNLIKKVA